MTLASVVIDNFELAGFLGEAIDSALAQTYEPTEVVVVDDGSRDGSRDVIAGYGSRVRPVLKANGGQTSALNAGLAAGRGEVVVFLDADDVLEPDAVEVAVAALSQPGVVKAHWPLAEIDADGRPTGELRPRRQLGRGPLLGSTLCDGPECHAAPPTSGNAWQRGFLEAVMPLPEIERELGVGSASADAYLSDLAPLFGSVAAIDRPLGRYRVHGANDYAGTGFEDKLARDIWFFDDRCERLARWCERLGLAADTERWRTRAWLHRFVAARRELDATVPPGETLVLIDGHRVGPELAPGRRAIPFLERDGEYWGKPADGATAVRELERLRGEGAHFAVVAWPAFWWLDHYPELAAHLRAQFECSLETDRLIAFDLRS